MDPIIRRHLEPVPETEDKAKDRTSSGSRPSAPLFTANNLAIFLIIMSHILYIIFQYTTANHVIKLIDLLPGSQPVPDLDRDHILQIIESRGFKPEQHFVTSQDGYILQLVRLVNPFATKSADSLEPILLHHGFQASGACWLVAADGRLDDHGVYHEYDEHGNLLVNGSHQVGNSLGFDLAARGYDVWLANYRGSIYSRNHTTLSVKDTEFWKFTIDEMVRYDLPAQIDYILERTNRSTLGYIGHSQGNVMMLAMMASNDRHSKLIKPYVAISPAWYRLSPDHREDLAIKTKIYLAKNLYKVLAKYPGKLGVNPNFRRIMKHLCSNHFVRNVCHKLYFDYLVGFLTNFDMDRMPVYIDHIGLGSSTWNFVQVVQYAQMDRFGYFDYGQEINMKKYGQLEAPEYDESRINNTNIAFIYSENDYVCGTVNIQNLQANMKVNLLDVYQVPHQTYDHLDLIWGKNVGELVNKKVLDILSRTIGN